MSSAEVTVTAFLLARVEEDERFWRSMPFGPTFGHAEMWERMKADCVAKRRLIERADRLTEDGELQAIGWDILGELAAVYADHPDYCDGWRA